MNTGSRLALFDLDGTLVDSAPDLADAVDQALTTHGHPACGEAKVRRFIGNGAGRLVHRALTDDANGEAQDSIFKPVFAEFLDVYAARLFERTTVYSGVQQVLTELKAEGWKLAIVTNKPARFSEHLIRLAGLEAFFDLIVSGDTLPAKKPDPAPVVHAMTQLGTESWQTIFIGDSETDIAAARNAGINCIVVEYGYHGDLDLGALDDCLTIAAFPALVPILRSLPGCGE